MTTLATLVAQDDVSQCWEDVTRRGERQPCNRLAVAFRRDHEDGGAAVYPVCARHVRRPMVLLTELIDAARGGS